MQLNINIEKKHLWLLILAIVAVGFVVAYNTNPQNPAVMGHSFGEIEGVPMNCIQGQNQGVCQALLPVASQTGGWSSPGVIGAYSALSYGSETLRVPRQGSPGVTDYVPSERFCQNDGTNCPAGVRSTTVHKIPANYNCQNSAFLCAVSSSQGPGPFVASPTWDSNRGSWTYRYWNNNQLTTLNCAWVLCSQPDPALP